MVTADGLGVFEAAYQLSISMKTLANWVRAAKDGKLENVGQTQETQTEIEAELGRFRRELARSENGARYFKKHPKGRAPAQGAETPRKWLHWSPRRERPSAFW
ncbi:hypothetical protein F6X39_05210 [Paraburkholderia sp. UCT2]|nr:hypothetical protein [Paraburkholderia sp. UCT2]